MLRSRRCWKPTPAFSCTALRSSELHEGLLQCLVQLANDEAGRAGLLPRARELAELCASHLLQTPSAQPLYVRQAKAELAISESPQRTHRARELTRELAMVCCLLLQRLAQELLVEAGAAEGEEAAKETSEERSLEPLREQVLTSLHRDNLNLHRLTRGHEPLRRAIAAARQAWEAEVGAEVARPPPKPRHRGMKSALAMRELLEEQEQKKRPGRSQPRKPAKDADGAVQKDAQAPAEPLEPPEPPEPGPGRPGRPGRPDGTASVASDGACSTGVADGVAAGEEQDYDVASYCSHVSEELASPTPTMHPSQLEEDVRLQNRSPSITSTSWHFEAAPTPTCDAVRRVEVQTTAAGPVPRMPQRSGAGRMSPPKASKSKDPPREAKKDAPVKTAKDAATEVTPDALMAEPGFTPEVCPRSHSLGHEDCPVLAGVFDYLAAGRVELAMQCIFSLGNEQTLRAVLQRLDSDAVWPELPKPEAQHLARLLVALVCRDPFSSAASEACPWLEALLRRPHGENLLPAEELLSLQGALFSASAVGGDVGPCAARLYFQLFQRQVQASASCPQLMFSSSRASAVPVILPQSCP